MPYIISRYDWNARSPKPGVHSTSWSSRTGFVVHHSGASMDQTVREIQNYHMDSNGWSDIGYNFLIDKRGRIYEGRGWSKIGAHVHKHNTANIGVCVIGDYTNRLPTVAALSSLAWLYGEANRRKGSTLTVYGHRDLGSTACPGTKFYKHLKHEFHSLDSAKPSKPKTSTSDDWTDSLMANLPMLKVGSKGIAVKRAQALLNVMGANIAEDGDFGPKTKTATITFQKAKKLDQDAIIGPKTWTKLVKG